MYMAGDCASISRYLLQRRRVVTVLTNDTDFGKLFIVTTACKEFAVVIVEVVHFICFNHARSLPFDRQVRFRMNAAI